MSKTKDAITIVFGTGITLGIRASLVQALVNRWCKRIGRLLGSFSLTAAFVLAASHHPDARLVCRCSAKAAEMQRTQRDAVNQAERACMHE